MIKHYRKKGNTSVLEMNEDRVILSNPYVQSFNEYIYNSKDDILYFYYDIKLQHNTTWYAFDGVTEEERDVLYPGIKPNWVTYATSSIYDFGTIHYLAECIDQIVKINPDEKGQKDYLYYPRTDTFSKTDFETAYELSCTGPLKEDSYLLKKRHKHFENSFWNEETQTYDTKDYVWYDVYIGLGRERNNTTGVMLYQLTEKELFVIKEWAEDFMEITKAIAQSDIEKMFESETDEYYHNPKWFHDHMEEKYPEDVKMWKDIWRKLYSETFILKEYWNYVKGNPIESPYFSKWQKNKLVAQELIKDGMKDWEAYCQLIDFYKNNG